MTAHSSEIRLPIEQGLLFVHTPKTAGTSFREALQVEFGQDAMFYDYGPDAGVRSSDVMTLIHEDSDFFALARLLASREGRVCLAGHFSVPRYAAFFRACNIITFLRDPVQRFVSNYEHDRRVYGLTKSMEAFLQEPRSQNIQTRVLGMYPLELIGFVGLQEYYSESLQMLQRLYQVNIPELDSNVNADKSASGYVVDDEMAANIRQKNQQDVELYQLARQVFLQRQALFAAGLDYVHGRVTGLENNKLAGWAIYPPSIEPVLVEVLVNDAPIAQIEAKNNRPAMRERNAGRHGYIGFDHTFKERLEPDDRVTCRVVQNGQILLGPDRMKVGSKPS